MARTPRDIRPLTDRLVRKIRLWKEYHSLGVPTIARRCKISDSRIRKMNDPSWNPTLDTLRRMESTMEPGFDADAIDAAYRRGIVRVRAWMKAKKVSRTQLVRTRGILWPWICDIDSPNWAPSWFALHKLLALVPVRFNSTHHRKKGTAENGEDRKRDRAKGKAA